MTGRVAATLVIARRAETAHHLHVLDLDAALLQLLNRQLQLVDYFGIEEEVLRPDRVLILGQEIAEPEIELPPESAGE